jgi:hypothetical protein
MFSWTEAHPFVSPRGPASLQAAWIALLLASLSAQEAVRAADVDELDGIR